MSKLPVVSGKQSIKPLEKIGFAIFRQRGSHITMVNEVDKTL
ncbi:MAG: type II toxin-antitoxin system HicA family toxin [Crocosphaera sp.]|nr:type II toxin-antitoxin system HicA family toxin [Crocosphaera sp.]